MNITTKEINKVYSTEDTSCNCDSCKQACMYMPGWFLPDEMKKVATYLKLSIQDLFDNKLVVDWWVGENDIFLLAPARELSETGAECPADPRGKCIFYRNQKCEIYPVRPFECRKYIHNESQEQVHTRHKVVASKWKDHQKLIVNLLKREPESKEFSMFDCLLGGFNSGLP